MDFLKALNASLCLGIIDLTPERAEVVRRLNQAGIPVTAWLLLPKDQGYWFNLDNAPQAVARYAAFKSWTAEYGLKWDRIGLDTKPDLRDLQQLIEQRWRMLPVLVRRSFNWRRLRRARKMYRSLVADIHADGYRVETCQFPFIVDERKAHTTLLQRVTGIVDLPTDREVLMLYTSFVRPDGAGFLWSYAPEAQSIGVGSTGGGVDIGMNLGARLLSWSEFSRDLRLAWYWNDDIFIFSLEGCVHQGFLDKIATFEWDHPILSPAESAARVEGWRGMLQTVLWFSTNFWIVTIGLIGFIGTIWFLRRRKKR
jgi:LPXTG-motif cell wall-anchored protein